MDDRGANIDVLFRNGLKDYEVLPPREVWNNIRPVIRKHQRPIIILRAAAMIAVMLSLSFLAYRWSMQVSTGFENSTITLNSEPETPVYNNQVNTIMPSGKTDLRIPLIADASLTEAPNENSVITDEEINAIQNIIYPSLTERILINNTEPVRIGLTELNRSQTGFFNNEDQATLYLNENAVRTEVDRWSIAALVSPTYYANFLTGNNELASQLISQEQPLISYSGGVALSYKINKRFSVQSGLYYSSFGQELAGISSFGGFRDYDYTKGDHNFTVMTADGVVHTDNADIFLLDNISNNRITTRYTNDVFDPSKANLEYIDNSLRQNFSYLELPIILRYKLVDKVIDFNLFGGLSSNVLVNNSVYAGLNGSRYQVGKTTGLNMISFSSSLGMGMEYSFSHNLSLNLEPTFRYFLNPFSEISGMRIHPYSFGIFSGLSYRF